MDVMYRFSRLPSLALNKMILVASAVVVVLVSVHKVTQKVLISFSTKCIETCFDTLLYNSQFKLSGKRSNGILFLTAAHSR